MTIILIEIMLFFKNVFRRAGAGKVRAGANAAPHHFSGVGAVKRCGSSSGFELDVQLW
jgi:hypothetical protein